MKRFSKILCVVLVVALLATCAIFTLGVSAATATVDAVATTSKDNSDMFNATNSPIDGNAINVLAWVASGTSNDPNTLLDSYIVTEKGSDDSYVALVSKDSLKGINAQYTLSASNMGRVTNQHYYVIDLDVATQSVMNSGIQIAITNRNSKAADTTMFGTPCLISKYVNADDGKWAHITLVGELDISESDIANSVNLIHVYVNGEYRGNYTGAVNATTLASGVTPDNFDGGNGLYAQGIKVDFPASATTVLGESILFDNASRRDYSAQDATANGLASIVDLGESGKISNWSGYPTVTREGDTVPYFATVDGVKYNNAQALSSVLTGNDEFYIEFTGKNVVPVTVSCDAVIDTNGFEPLLTYIDGCDISTDGDIITVNAPFQSPISKAPVTAATANTTALNALRFPASDNLLKKLTNQYVYSESTAADYIQQYIVSILGDNKEYLSHEVTKDTSITSVHHTHINFDIMGAEGASTDGYIIRSGSSTDTNQYAIFEWDMYTDGKMPYGMYIGLTTRDVRGGSNKGGTSVYLDDYQTANNISASLPVGEWYHLTLVGDIQTNTLYVYINNNLIFTRSSGITNTPAILTTGTATLYGPRVNVYCNGKTLDQTKGMNFAVDNYYARVLTGAEAGNLAANIGAATLSTWDKNIYDQDYIDTYVPAIAPIAEVNGVKYNDLASLNAALLGNEPKQVELLREISGVIDIRCNAVINTNGLAFVKDVNYTLPADILSFEQNGEIITVTVPYQPNASWTQNQGSNLSSILNSSAAGNILSGSTPYMANNGDNSVLGDAGERLIPINVLTNFGDSYLAIIADESIIGGNYTENPYVYIENYSIKDDSNRLDADSFYVIDLDVYTESEFIQNMSISPTNRNTATGSGFPFGDGFTISNFVKPGDGWTHLTYVADVENNSSYVFVDGQYAAKVGVAYRDGFNTIEQGIYAVGLRVNLSAGINVKPGQMIGIRGISERVFKSNAAAGDIAAAITAGTLDGWSNNIAGYQGKAPAVATINGVEYDNVIVASNALVGDATANVVLTRDFEGTITVDTNAIVETNGFDGVTSAKYLTEVYDSYADAFATVVGPYSVSENGTVITYTKVTEDNLADTTAYITWAYDDGFVEYDEVFYAFGTEITYVGSNPKVGGNYIDNGVLYTFNGWLDDAGDPAQFGTASIDFNYVSYIADITEEQTDITLPGGAMYNYTLDTGYSVNIYVPADYAVEGSAVIDINGAKYAVYSGRGVFGDSGLAYANVSFVYEGVTYTEKITADLVQYASAIMNGNFSTEMKQLIVATVMFSDAIYKDINGESFENLAAFAAMYPEFVPAVKESFDAIKTDALKSILKNAQFYVDYTPCYVFERADGFDGDITISYTGTDGKVYSETFSAGDAIVLNIRAYDLNTMLSIESAEVSANYNLEAYIAGLIEQGDDTAVVEAMYYYAAAAEAYKLACLAAIG